MREAAEGGLAVLAERDVFVGLELLEPGAEAELMAAARERDAIFVGVQIARDPEVAAVVAAGEADAGLRIRSSAATDDDGADGEAGEESGNGCGGSAGRGFTGEEVAGARVADARGVEQAWGEDVGFFEAENLFAQREDVGAIGIRGGGGEVVAIVDGVHGGEGIFLRKDVIEAERAEIFADGLKRAAEDFCDAVEIGRACGSDGPKIQERLHAGDGGGARSGVGNKGGARLVKILAEAFVVAEDEGVVAADRAACGSAELIALEWRSGALVEEAWSIERVVAEKFVDGAVEIVGAGLRGDDDLPAGMLAEFGAVVVALDVEFADGIDAEQLAAGPAGRHVVFGGAGEFDAVEEKDILLRAVAVDGEIAGRGGVGDSGAAGFLRSEINNAGIQGQQQVVAAAVQRQIFDGLLADEAGDVGGGGADHGSVKGNLDNVPAAVHCQRHVEGCFLIDGQNNSATHKINETRRRNYDRVLADRQSEHTIDAYAVR